MSFRVCCSSRHALVAFTAVLLFLSASGCVNLAAHLLHAGMGERVKPRYDGLKTQRVAVVCVSQSATFGPTAAAHEIAKRVEKYLAMNVEEIQIIDQQKIDAWMDENDWNQIDYREIGQGVDAQKLVAIEIKSYSLHEGNTLFKGRADIRVAVYDLTNAETPVVFEEIPPQIQYPITSGVYSADTTEEAFERGFIDVISSRVARDFYTYDLREDFGRDPTNLGF